MLTLEALTKRFGSTVAVEDLSLQVSRGEFLSLLGPSGCGKTTTLRMIAGFEKPTAGRILVEEQEVTRLPPQRRGFGMVFQSYALFPHLNVQENVAFGLKAKRVPGGEIQEKVAQALARVDLVGFERRSVQALSGGQQQRVALARAIAPEPPLLLLDEPLSNLDAALRERTRDELRTLLKRVGITSVFVTHDQEEAFALSDRIAVLRAGRLQQVGTPEDLYQSPVNPFVASFVGRANFIEGTVVGREDGEGTVELPSGARWKVRLQADAGARVRVMVRPEALRILPLSGPAGAGDLVGRIVERRYAGATTTYRVEVPGSTELLVTAGGQGGSFAGDVVVTTEQGPHLRAFPVEDG